MGRLTAGEEKNKKTAPPLSFGGVKEKEMEMEITADKIKSIIGKLEKLSPQNPVLSGDRRLTLKEAIAAMAPTIKKMYDRGFGTDEIVTVLKAQGVEVKAQTLRKYMRDMAEAADAPGGVVKPAQPKPPSPPAAKPAPAPTAHNPAKSNL